MHGMGGTEAKRSTRAPTTTGAIRRCFMKATLVNQASEPAAALCHKTPAVVATYIRSLIPLLINIQLVGKAVRNPATIATCIISQNPQ